MLNRILSAIPKGSSRFPMKYYQMLETFGDRCSYAKMKFTVAPAVRTPGAELLRFMLLNCNLETAKSYESDLDRKMLWADPYRQTFRPAFDPTVTKTLSSGKFFACKLNGFPIKEVFINAFVADADTYYPYNKDWIEWKDLRSIRLIHHTSYELPIDFISNTITFQRKKPTFAVVAINTTTLLMKWYKYTVFCESSGQTADPLEFIKMFELSNLYDDLGTVWITNLLNLVLRDPTLPTDRIVSELYVPAFIAPAGVIARGIDSLKETLSLVKNRVMKLQDVIDTRWYPEKTIRDEIIDVTKDVAAPEGGRMYLWLDVLRSIPFLRLVTRVFELDPSNPNYDLLMNRSEIVYNRLFRMGNMANGCSSPHIREYMEYAKSEFAKIFAARQKDVALTDLDI